LQPSFVVAPSVVHTELPPPTPEEQAISVQLYLPLMHVQLLHPSAAGTFEPSVVH
jgi:hypothetical protein